MLNNIVLTGGGTAGHVMPNIALLPTLRQNFDNIYYIGSYNGIERSIIEKEKDITYFAVDTIKLIRGLTLKNLCIPFVLIKSIIQCKNLLKKIRPKVVFSKGGYVAVPVVIAAHQLHIPVVAHESDSSIGLANKIIYKRCDKMFFSFKEAMSGYEKKGVYSGSPIRKEFFTNKEITQNTKPTIVVIGGSLGSQAINKAIISSLDVLKKYYIINIVGKGNINPSINNPNYKQVEYIDNVADVLRNADIVISRAGSNTIFELLAMKKLMLLIPLPKDASRGDQIINANIFEKNGYALVLQQENLSKTTLVDAIEILNKNKSKYIQNMSKANKINAVDLISKELISYV